MANDLETMKVLLSYHANISAVEPLSGRSAMSAAFSNRFIEVGINESGRKSLTGPGWQLFYMEDLLAQAAWILLEYGGDPDEVDGNGVCARELAQLDSILKKFVELYDDGKWFLATTSSYIKKPF